MGEATLIIRRFLLFVCVGIHRLLAVLGIDSSLHRARFAQTHELVSLLSLQPTAQSLLLGISLLKHFLLIRPTQTRKELGNLLIVGPTRSGKGLLATSQLLTWGHSVVVNDLKGELFTATAGYRSTLGRVFVLDPEAFGHQYDPLQGKTTEDQVYSAAARLLYDKDERERIFTERATGMLTQLFLAARLEGVTPFPYVRRILRLGLAGAAKRLAEISPDLCTQFLDVSFEEANFSDRFLLSAWGTLTTKMKPLLTETVIRCFAGSDFTPAQLLFSDRPVSVYLRWPERDLLALSPLVRLVWGSIIDELITSFDRREGKGCKPVLLLVDEAGRTAIPSLADHATTVVGRGVSLWIAIQSLEQLRAEYGEARAQVLRDNMETQIYYPPNGLETATYLSDCLGRVSAYAHSQTVREGVQTAQGLSEQGIPLMTAQEIKQLTDEEIIGFHRRLPPFRLTRMDWRKHDLLVKRARMSAPALSVLPEVTAIPEAQSQTLRFPDGYIDPDLMNKGRERAEKTGLN